MTVSQSAREGNGSMVMPRVMGRLSRRVTNPVARRFAGRVPGMGVLGHRGRRSDREYGTPVFALRTGDGFAFVLAYGSEVDWLRNVKAAGHAELRTRGRTVQLSQPRLVGHDRRPVLPLFPSGWCSRSSTCASIW